MEERRSREAVQVAETIAGEDIDRSIGALKASISKALAEVAERLAAESARYRSLQGAIASKERELQELYGIEKSAASLAALIESQNQRRQQFEADMAGVKDDLTAEIESTRAEWEREKKQREAEVRERDAADKKAREREKEEFAYAFKREQQALRDQMADEKKKLEQEIAEKAIEGSAQAKAYGELQKVLAEQARRPGPEK